MLNKVLNQITLSDLLIFIVIDNSTLEEVLYDNNIVLTDEEMFDSKDELYNKLQEV